MMGTLHLTKDGDTSEIPAGTKIGVAKSVISRDFAGPNEIKRSARAFVKIAKRYPHAELGFVLHGFEGETRCLAEVPEALDLVRRWAEAVREIDPRPLARMGRTSSLMLMVAEGRGRFVPTGPGRGLVDPIEGTSHVN